MAFSQRLSLHGGTDRFEKSHLWICLFHWDPEIMRGELNWQSQELSSFQEAWPGTYVAGVGKSSRLPFMMLVYFLSDSKTIHTVFIKDQGYIKHYFRSWKSETEQDTASLWLYRISSSVITMGRKEDTSMQRLVLEIKTRQVGDSEQHCSMERPCWCPVSQLPFWNIMTTYS